MNGLVRLPETGRKHEAREPEYSLGVDAYLEKVTSGAWVVACEREVDMTQGEERTEDPELTQCPSKYSNTARFGQGSLHQRRPIQSTRRSSCWS